MDWRDRSLAEIFRLLATLDAAGGDEFVQGLIARSALPADMPHPRITLRSLIALLNQTRGSTILPQAIVDQLHAPELLVAVPPIILPANDVFLTIASNGRTGEQFITDLEQHGFDVGHWAREVLRSAAFVPTNGVTYRLAIIRGDELSSAASTNARIRALAAERGYRTPPMEVAPLLRQRFVNNADLTAQLNLEELAVMHPPWLNSSGGVNILEICPDNEGRCLYGRDGQDSYRWGKEPRVGFVFLAPE